MQPDVSHLRFRKSSYSSSHGQNCVEVADTVESSVVRDSQHPDTGQLAFPSAEWRAFLDGLDEL